MAGKDRSAFVAYADEALLKDSWQWAADLGASKGFGVRIAITPTSRPGVWTIRAQACEVVDGRATGVDCQVTHIWPSSEARTFATAIFRAISELAMEIAADPLQKVLP